MSDLTNIEGVGPLEEELLQATGWTDVQSLAKADVDVLTRELAAANTMLKIMPRTPGRPKVERWVSAAIRLLDPGAVPVGKKTAVVTAAAETGEAIAPGRTTRRRSAKTVSPAEPVAASAAAVAGDPLQTAGEDRAAEAGLVNYEAEQEVQEMLAAAPLAIPIPARTLAERGIGPSEIAVAALLNRASGDLEVRVTVEKPVPKDIPEAPAGGRRTMTAPVSVQVSDSGPAPGRRGIDASKVRTIEEVQGDAPPVRASSSKAGMQDDRIALLRSPLPETNKGRKPGSRFYIRGVLHDQPLKVWFGGLFAVLLQLSVPLAVIAAPLLILSNEKQESFQWVPKWIIAFPISLPVLGLLYILVSARAKCRVCAQRLYVPKHCLKNRKAHHLPLLGHIGALALHVMTFKWFNCTFCGTSIRIKK